MKVLEVKVQEEKGGRQRVGRRNKVAMRMEGRRELLKKIWKAMKAPVKEYGGSMSFIQESDASTPSKDRSKGREQMTRLEEARERARQEVKILLSGDREQELEMKQHRLSDERTRLDNDIKQLLHNETMGNEVIEKTETEIIKNQASLDELSNTWREAKENFVNDEDNMELKRDVYAKKKQKDFIVVKVKSMAANIAEEKKKLEDERQRIGETNALQERLEDEKKKAEQE